jgi:ribose transport system substrate-binding protein
MKKVLVLLIVVAMTFGLVACGGPAAKDNEGEQANVKAGEDLTFVVVPKVVHEWFDLVAMGANQQAELMSKAMGIKITIDYRAPSTADVTAQNTVLEQAAATNPAGICLDPIDYSGSKQVIEEIQAKGIPVVLFDARVPGSGLCAIGNEFDEQAELEARDLAKRIGEKGKIAIMHGVTTAPNHDERYQTFKRVLAEYPNIEVVDGGASQDNIETSQQQAAAVIAANPDLAGYLCVDAAAPIGISAAIEEAGKTDQITFVGAENLLQILEYVKSGTIVASYSTKPQQQGALSVLMMWNAYIGGELPQWIDTGILYIDQDNVDEMIEEAEAFSNK